MGTPHRRRRFVRRDRKLRPHVLITHPAILSPHWIHPMKKNLVWTVVGILAIFVLIFWISRAI
jgi:hypothetical protein